VTCVAELTVKLVAITPPNVTFVVCVSPLPVMTTCAPTAPLVGPKLEMTGMTLNFLLLIRVRDSVVTVTDPVVPVTGTTAVMYVSETTWNMVPSRYRTSRWLCLSIHCREFRSSAPLCRK
jgi:hypothetical protein